MEEKKKELVSFLRWMQEEPDKFWLFVSEDRASAELCLETVEELIGRGFYTLVPVFLGKVNTYSMESLFMKLFLGKMAEWLESNSMETIMEEIREVFKKAIEEEKARKEEER